MRVSECFSGRTISAALALVAGMATLSAAHAETECEKEYDRCTQTCTDVNDCPGGCLGCNMGCLIAKVICDWERPVALDHFAAFDPMGGHEGAGPILTYAPGEAVVMRAGLYRVGDPNFRYDGSTPFANVEDVVDVRGVYRPRSAREGGDWVLIESMSSPLFGMANPSWEGVIILDEEVDPYGYDVRFHFLMADGSVRRADTVLRRQCPGDANFDGVIGFDDLNLVLEQYGMANNGPSQYLAGDLTRDQVVDFDDLNEVLAHWGERCH